MDQEQRKFWEQWNKEYPPTVVAKEPEEAEFISVDSSLESWCEAEGRRGGAYSIVLWGGRYYVCRKIMN